ncbi:MAG: glucose dehydrogenase [Chloroflexota bacterium]|nr:PQQ-dependent sugar dehydrogenase [Ardenticatenaceae bacterium]GIK57637.1 MAG: glucose dehydrogenase [Chloroflexota bacterium]
MKQLSCAFCFIFLFLLPGCSIRARNPHEKPVILPPADEWAVQPGFYVEVDTQGYEFPTAIAFVPEPGPNPKDPLYFVTELRGKIKVITNDRTVYTFADDFGVFKPLQELPHEHAQNGLVSVCLAPEQGYVFVTFAYQKNMTIHNSIIRFQTPPITFATSPTSYVEFKQIFDQDATAYAHQIGHCQVVGNTLYVGVGDAWRSEEAQSLDSTNGKVLRMTLDGEPLPDNPFFQDGNFDLSANYIWAYGFRNPFGLVAADDSLYVAENGLATDRFLKLEAGQNYLWDGSDWSIGARADMVFYPSIGPVQVDYYDETLSLFPQSYSDKFYVATFGDPTRPAGIVMIDYNMVEDRLMTVPTEFMSYRGQAGGLGNSVIGLAFGHDGLYFAPLYSSPDGLNYVFRVGYDPLRDHTKTLSDQDPYLLMNRKGCFGCHQLDGQGGTMGPPLDRDGLVTRIQARVNSPEYARAIANLEKDDSEPFASYTTARQEVMKAKGMEQVGIWVKYHILEPRFDNPFAQMPSLGLSEQEAEIIADELLKPKRWELADPVDMAAYRIRGQIDSRFLPLRYRHLLFAFAVGILLASATFGVVLVIIKHRH